MKKTVKEMIEGRIEELEKELEKIEKEAFEVYDRYYQICINIENEEIFTIESHDFSCSLQGIDYVTLLVINANERSSENFDFDDNELEWTKEELLAEVIPDIVDADIRDIYRNLEDE